jgi:hypothetical protein
VTKKEVKIGNLYSAKVSDRLVDVRIDSTNSHGGWNATNTATGKRIHIKSAQRLRGPALSTISAADQRRIAREMRAEDAAATAAEPEVNPTVEVVTGQPVPEATPAKRSRKAAGEPKPKRVSLLDAAIEILRRKGEPMRTKELVAEAAAAGLWTSPAGRTPEATLFSALLREIATKGDQARVKKADRGLFAATQVA